MYKLAYFVTHPIQYQAPLLRQLSLHPEIDLHVFFLCNPHTEEYVDEGFNQKVSWDVPLLEGYKYEFIDSDLKLGRINFQNPKVDHKELKQVIQKGEWDSIWFHGYINKALLYGIWVCSQNKIPFFFRAESNLCCTSTGFFKDRLIRWIVRKATGLLWISSDNKDYYKHYGAPDEKLFFVPYAVDNHFFQELPKVEKDPEKQVVLYASKFIKRKHAPLLIEAFYEVTQEKKLKNVELWFIGDGEEKQVMENLIVKYGCENIKMLGFKNQTELPSYFSQCDVFVLPSQKEPFGLIINEVMNAAKPIITTAEVGSARDLVKPGINGWVIEAGSKKALKNALSEALSVETDLVKMGQQSLAIINEWSFEQDVEGICAALKRIKNEG
jgi:glycosyltransferase involved in cell wall biosynthesis